QAAATVVIVGVELEVLGEVGDPLRQDRDLDLCGARVARGPGVLMDDVGLLVFGERHDRRSIWLMTKATSGDGRLTVLFACQPVPSEAAPAAGAPTAVWTDSTSHARRSRRSSAARVGTTRRAG